MWQEPLPGSVLEGKDPSPSWPPVPRFWLECRLDGWILIAIRSHVSERPTQRDNI